MVKIYLFNEKFNKKLFCFKVDLISFLDTVNTTLPVDTVSSQFKFLVTTNNLKPFFIDYGDDVAAFSLNYIGWSNSSHEGIFPKEIFNQF